jgi:Zn-dependent M28 family amino/carboxypeptidase
MGSRTYAAMASKRGERIRGMIALETIGCYSDLAGSQEYPFGFGLLYPTSGNFIGFVGNIQSRGMVRRAIETFRNTKHFPSEGVAAPGWFTGVGWSDHWSFWKEGVPAIMITDTALFRYKYYHTAGDSPDEVDYERTARVVSGIRTVVVDLAL